MGRDARRVQTAVVGHKDSEVPVVLPPETVAAETFRRVYRGSTFWCGTLLGGCGGQLTTRLPAGRVAHFAHYPHSDGQVPVCSRRAVSTASADHLYIKAGLSDWLTGQGHASTAVLPVTEQAPVGSLVEIRLTSGTLVRIHLDDRAAPAWTPGVITILSADVPVPADLLKGCLYVHRIRCETQGTIRRVLLGTELPWRGTRWFDLSSCRVTPDGALVTPAVTEAEDRRAAAAAPRRAPRPPTPAPPVRSVADPRAAGADPKRNTDAERTAAGLDEARAGEAADRLRVLLGTGERIRPACDGESLARLLRAMDDARFWLASREQAAAAAARAGAFARLDATVRRHRYAELPAAHRAARKAATPPLTAEERSALDKAEVLIRLLTGKPGPPSARARRPARTARTPPAPEPPAHPPLPLSATAEPQRTVPASTSRPHPAGPSTPPPPAPGPAATTTAQPAPVTHRAVPHPGPTATDLAEALRTAQDRGDLAALAELCEQAASYRGPDAKYLHVPVAAARSRLHRPERTAAAIEVRTGLTRLAQHGSRLTAGELATAVRSLEELAGRAGGVLPSYDQAALAAWRSRLQDM